MNVRLYDGTVRCTDHFDASTYACLTDLPCLYCGKITPDVKPEPVTETDQAWLDALSTLVTDLPRRTIRLGKSRQCDYCPDNATWSIDHTSGVDHLCTDHGTEWYPDLFPLANVTVS